VIFSCVIPCSSQDVESQKLKDLVASIRSQDFDQSQIEILIETEGDSEQAKANGIRKAKGAICAMFCADNLLIHKKIFKDVKWLFDRADVVGVYTKYYRCKKDDNSLNRYFSLMGNNDPVAFYLDKADRKPVWTEQKDEMWSRVSFKDKVPSLGDNGFFWHSETLKNRADLNHYYPMDVAEDMRKLGHYAYVRCNGAHIWHRTTNGNLLTFLIKRYKYARDLYCDRNDRRWKMLEGNKDYRNLLGFVVSTITIIPVLCISIRGFIKIKDPAWFWHWPVCFGFLITYGILVCRNLLKYRSLFQRVEKKTYANV